MVRSLPMRIISRPDGYSGVLRVHRNTTMPTSFSPAARSFSTSLPPSSTSSTATKLFSGVSDPARSQRLTRPVRNSSGKSYMYVEPTRLAVARFCWNLSSRGVESRWPGATVSPVPSSVHRRGRPVSWQMDSWNARACQFAFLVATSLMATGGPAPLGTQALMQSSSVWQWLVRAPCVARLCCTRSPKRARKLLTSLIVQPVMGCG
mmetsp:Transcript_53893/g.140380  ORF Transcript_53893/g.140380 Transcript_53893/m.140380 type:complete len:206 (+) Transcript_53893:290-907(+)